MESKGFGAYARLGRRQRDVVFCGRMGKDGHARCSGKLGWILRKGDKLVFRPYGRPFPLCGWIMTQDKHGRIIHLGSRAQQQYKQGYLPRARNPIDIEYYRAQILAGASSIQGNDVWKPLRAVCPQCRAINHVDPAVLGGAWEQDEELRAQEREQARAAQEGQVS